MRVSRLFRRICAKVVDADMKISMVEEVVETVCTIEKELPPSVFVIMMHLQKTFGRRIVYLRSSTYTLDVPI